MLSGGSSTHISMGKHFIFNFVFCFYLFCVFVFFLLLLLVIWARDGRGKVPVGSDGSTGA